jgi:hypothetical protein
LENETTPGKKMHSQIKTRKTAKPKLKSKIPTGQKKKEEI